MTRTPVPSIKGLQGHAGSNKRTLTPPADVGVQDDTYATDLGNPLIIVVGRDGKLSYQPAINHNDVVDDIALTSPLVDLSDERMK